MESPRKKSEVYEMQMLARASSMDPVWMSATKQMEKMKCARELRVRRYRIEQWMSFFAIVSIVATALTMQFGINNLTHYASYFEVNSTVYVNILRAIISICTLVLLVLVLYRTDTVCKLRIVTFRLPPHVKFYYPSAGLLWKVIAEIVIISLHVPPSWSQTFIESRFMSGSLFNKTTLAWSCPTPGDRLDGYFCFTDLPWHSSHLDVIVFLRVYILFRWVRHRLGFESVDIEWLGTEWHVPTQSLGFTAKYMFHEHPVKFAVFAFATTWFLTSVVVEFLEHMINFNIDSNFEALWLIVLTMSSAGLGSSPPVSLQGQIAIAAGGIIGGAVMGALITSVLIESLRVTLDENAVIDTVHARTLHMKNQVSAIDVLEHFAHFVLLHKQKASRSALRKAKTSLFWATLEFKKNRYDLAHLSRSTVTVLDLKTADVAFRSTRLMAAVPQAHTSATLDALERKLHAVHGALLAKMQRSV
ncbi:hypothetical protein AC1031_015403 [Aphanomyces cochlioides]|nr:hypothetical protein AC1031_015403 [Aphanomyces cochlioides]